ncbi:hypothetical protein RND71_015757 [Anisodus tanguticus]|uniref:Uncharacterized protein n=1 Tax=Anisodus tanguticus TaxID=243964 RepID=A0AAE1S7G2_9SOLA|nr:hypothetical protein RND71_015757 [Anisodus tanguticus]
MVKEFKPLPDLNIKTNGEGIQTITNEKDNFPTLNERVEISDKMIERINQRMKDLNIKTNGKGIQTITTLLSINGL